MNPCIAVLPQIMDTLTNKSDIEIGNGKRKKMGPKAFLGISWLIAMTILLAILAGLFGAPTALASKAKLNDIIVTNTRDDLLIYLNVEGAFPQKMKEAVLSGVPSTFSYFIALYQKRSFWFDKKVADLTITHSIKFNRLKNEFTISRSWQNGPPTIVNDFSQAQSLMVAVDNLKVVSLDRLTKGQQYQIRAKAELDTIQLPFYLHYPLFFVSLWDFETDWYTIDFIY